MQDHGAEILQSRPRKNMYRGINGIFEISSPWGRTWYPCTSAAL